MSPTEAKRRRRHFKHARTVLTFTMHNALRAAASGDGFIRAGDNGVVNALIRRGLAVADNYLTNDVVVASVRVTAEGRKAAREAKIDPKSRPTWLSDEKWAQYMKAWGA